MSFFNHRLRRSCQINNCKTKSKSSKIAGAALCRPPLILLAFVFFVVGIFGVGFFGQQRSVSTQASYTPRSLRFHLNGGQMPVSNVLAFIPAPGECLQEHLFYNVRCFYGIQYPYFFKQSVGKRFLVAPIPKPIRNGYIFYAWSWDNSNPFFRANFITEGNTSVRNTFAFEDAKSVLLQLLEQHSKLDEETQIKTKAAIEKLLEGVKV